MKEVIIGTGVIKGISHGVGDALSQFADKEYDDFIEFYLDVRENSSITKSQILKLAELDMFAEFGSPAEIQMYVEILDKYANSKVIRKVAIADGPFTEDQIKKYAERETAKQYRMGDMMPLIKETVQKIKGTLSSPKINTMISEGSLVGVPLSTYPAILQSDFQDSLAIVYFIEKPRWFYGDSLVHLFRVGSGDVEEYRVAKRQAEMKGLEEGQVIRTIHSSETYSEKWGTSKVLINWDKFKV